MTKPCCERDTDGDGNCPIHPELSTIEEDIARCAMTTERDAILEVIRRRDCGRPVRWASNEWTVEVFDVAKVDRLSLRKSLWDLFTDVRKHFGKQLSLVTHTPEDTDALYVWARTEPAPRVKL